MKTIASLTSLLFLFSPLYCLAGDITGHQIIVPEEYAWGREKEGSVGTSPIESYIEAYERTWWKVMNAFVYEDADWENHSNFICSGTPAEAQACIDSYKAASEKIAAYLKVAGEKEYRELVRKRLNQR